MWMQFNVGQCVHMMSVKNNKQKMEIGKINGVGGADKFHFKLIPDFCYKVDVNIAHLGDVRLPYPLEDVVGGNTLWIERNLKAT